MVFNSTNARIWSKLGARGSFGATLLDIAAVNKDILAMSADLCNTSGLDRFRSAYSDRFINVGIAEQNMIGIAAGLADCGNTVFATTFSNFIALRSCEQVRHFLSYMKSNVKIVGLSAGFSLGMFGNTHYGKEDIAIMRSFPNITILSPADSMETVKATIAASQFHGPVYLRLTGGMNNPIVYKEDYDYVIGKAITLSEGDDVAIFATGTMVYQALGAAKKLEEVGISVSVVDMHTLKPIDEECIERLGRKSKMLVTVEEHSYIGGLGGAVAESLAKKGGMPVLLTIGAPDSFGHAGDYSFLLDKMGLTAEKIAQKILLKYNEEIRP